MTIPDFEGDDLFPGNDIQSLFTANGRKNDAESFTTFSATQISNGDLLTLLSDVVVKVQYFAAKDDEKSDTIILNPTAIKLVEGWLSQINTDDVCLIIPSLIGTSITVGQIKKWNNVKIGFGLLVSINHKDDLCVLKASLSIDFQTVTEGSFSFPMSTLSVPLTLPIFEISK